MSVKRMSSVWDSSIHKGSSLLLLLAIADNANDYGHAWPGIEVLSKKTRLSERQVMRIIQVLEDSGELFVFRREGCCNHYLVLTGFSEDEREKAFAALNSYLRQNVTGNVSLPVTHMSPGGDIDVTSTSDNSVTRTIIRTITKHHSSADLENPLTEAAAPPARMRSTKVVSTEGSTNKASKMEAYILEQSGSKELSEAMLERIGKPLQVYSLNANKMFTLPSLIEIADGDPNFLPALTRQLGFRRQHKPRLSRNDVIAIAERFLQPGNEHSYYSWLEQNKKRSPVLPNVLNSTVEQPRRKEKEEDIPNITGVEFLNFQGGL